MAGPTGDKRAIEHRLIDLFYRGRDYVEAMIIVIQGLSEGMSECECTLKQE
jgi:hypothetical protein